MRTGIPNVAHLIETRPLLLEKNGNVLYLVGSITLVLVPSTENFRHIGMNIIVKRVKRYRSCLL